MPSTYAHRRFGANVLDHLPRAAGKLEAHRELYDIGLHGPDLLFYYHAEKSTPVAALGNAMHDEPAERFLTGHGGWCTRKPTARLRWPTRWLCVSFCTGQHLPPLCGAVHPGERCDPLRDRDRVRQYAAAPGRL